MNALALLLVATLATEQSYGPYARPANGGYPSTAAARGNVLLAWSEDDATGLARVHVVLLDSGGRAISPIRVLPALTPARDALVPAVGTDGASFLILWEEALGMQRTVAMPLDPYGAPLGEPRPLTPDTPIAGNDYQPARVHWTGAAYAVLTGTRKALWVDAGGHALDWIVGVVPEAVDGDGTFGRAVAGVTTVGGGFGPFQGPSVTYPTMYWFIGAQRNSELFPVGTVLGTPYITAAGTQFVVTWTTAGRLHYRPTSTTLRGANADVDQFARPRARCAQTHCVIAYATRRGDIEAVVFDHTRADLPAERFTIAATERAEREPEVVMITDTRALVTWRSSGVDGERLAGRTLHLARPKQRAVR